MGIRRLAIASCFASLTVATGCTAHVPGASSASPDDRLTQSFDLLAKGQCADYTSMWVADEQDVERKSCGETAGLVSTMDVHITKSVQDGDTANLEADVTVGTSYGGQTSHVYVVMRKINGEWFVSELDNPNADDFDGKIGE